MDAGPPGRGHWSERLADAVEERCASASGASIVCASGISPSGPIHLGNLREVFTTHLVVDALRRRGHPAVHLHSWDDYDRLRKVPLGIDPAYSRYIGMPLTEIPDPAGVSASYADHFIDEFTMALTELGIELTPVRQSTRYPMGTYNPMIRRAMDARELIFDTLAEQQTLGRYGQAPEERRRGYFPFKPYCEVCRRDETSVRAYAKETVHYTCRHGHEGTMSLADGARISGKLVWKVDWPMRWSHEGVAFEPAGEDHHAPTGSFTVGRTLVEDVFGERAPVTAVYSFVALAGGPGKMSGSAGGAATPATALRFLEPALVRWPYVQRLPAQSFSIDLSPKGVQKLYDHWDRFAATASGPDAKPEHAAIHRLTVESASGLLRRTERAVSFRLLASVADLTQANRQQIGRIVAAHLSPPVPPIDRLLAELEPRLGCAIRYATELVPRDERTVVRDSFAQATWNDVDADMRRGVETLTSRLANDWSLDGLTTLVYSVPKLLLGLAGDAPPTPEVKSAQREFFKVLYLLLCDAQTGPRLPTLMLSIGLDHTQLLLHGSPPRGSDEQSRGG